VESGVIAGLAKAIGYPQEVPAEAEAFDFIVDGETIGVSVADGRARSPSAPHGGASLLFQTVLTEDAETAGRLAAYAAGRMLKEAATLAWDPEKKSVILWEKVEFEGQGHGRRAFESFCESADWWRERVKEQGHGHAGVAEMMIRP